MTENLAARGDADNPAVPLLDLDAIHKPIAGPLREAVIRVLESNRFIGGPEVEQFEAEIAAACGSRHAVGVSSGTDALIVSLMALGVKPGDEVIVPSFTFFSTAGSVHRLGAKLVFCDIEPRTFNLDPEHLKTLVTPKTRVVIPVHLFGQCAPMDIIADICRPHGIKIIEDAAQAIGAGFHGRQAGTMGDTGCLSFFPSKNLGGIGDGGLVFAQDDELADRVRSLRDHGARKRYYHSRVGGNFRLDSIQAAALRVKLPHLEAWHRQRRANAAEYQKAMVDLEEKGLLKLPVEIPGMKHVFNQFVIRVKNRESLLSHLAENQIGTAIYYPVPLHLQECFADLGYKEGSLAQSEQAAKEVLALPIFPGLSTAQREKVVRCIRAFLTRQ